jgi:hypothetical protein
VQVGRVGQVLGDEHDPRRDGVEVSARPRLLLALLDRIEVGRGRLQGLCHQVPPGVWVGLSRR